jgi:hypothetical protein
MRSGNLYGQVRRVLGVLSGRRGGVIGIKAMELRWLVRYFCPRKALAMISVTLAIVVTCVIDSPSPHTAPLRSLLLRHRLLCSSIRSILLWVYPVRCRRFCEVRPEAD